MCSCKQKTNKQPAAVKQVVKKFPVRTPQSTQTTPKKTVERKRVIIRRPI